MLLLEPVLKAIKEKIQMLFHLQWTRATVDLQMTSTMWLLMDSSVADLKLPAKIVDRYTPSLCRKLEDFLHKYYEAGYIPKDVATSDTGYDLSQDTWLVREWNADPDVTAATRVAKP